MCQHLTVAENMFLGRERRKGLKLSQKEMNAEAARVLKSLDIDLDPTTMVGSLQVSKQQMDAYESPHRDRNGVVDSEVSGSKSHPSRGPWQRRGGSAIKQDVEWPPQGCRPLLILILSDLRSDGTERFVRSSGRGSAHMAWGQ